MHILAVDDDRLMLELITEMLHGLGLDKIKTASSAEEALVTAKLADRPFDCFLLDIDMPGGSGIQLCADLRGIDVYRNTPMIMLTAKTERHFINDAFLAGATDYINKPFNEDNLGDRLFVALNHLQRCQQNQAVPPQLLYPGDGPFSEFDNGGYLELLELPAFVSNRALNKYLEKLNRIGNCNSTAIAVHLDLGVAVQSKDAVPRVLVDFAASLSKSLNEGVHLVTYVGSGRYVLCSLTDQPIFSAQWRKRLRARFRYRSQKYAALGISDTRLKIGAVVAQHSFADEMPMLMVERALKQPGISELPRPVFGLS